MSTPWSGSETLKQQIRNRESGEERLTANDVILLAERSDLRARLGGKAAGAGTSLASTLAKSCSANSS